jgi:1-acyl-sn-glycerol-3-phosphate acyltransferase
MNRVPFSVRLLRCGRFCVHALRGWWLSHLHFGKGNVEEENVILKHWSRGLLRLLGVRVEVSGLPPQWPHGSVLVANHISWLDIFLIYTEAPGLFVAKSEIRSWPLIGSLIARVGTLFIERGSPRHARRMNTQMAEALAQDRLICLFPEGATTEGREVLPFHAALLQPAIACGAFVIPIALRYTEADGSFCAAPNYAGETSLPTSLWRILSHRGLRAQLHFLPPLSAVNAERRALARQTEALIAAKLELPITRKRSEIPVDLPDAAP